MTISLRLQFVSSSICKLQDPITIFLLPNNTFRLVCTQDQYRICYISEFDKLVQMQVILNFFIFDTNSFNQALMFNTACLSGNIFLEFTKIKHVLLKDVLMYNLEWN